VRKLFGNIVRRNFQLRDEEILSIVCPINDGSSVCGVGIFSKGPAEVEKIMDEDSGVKAGIFTYMKSIQP
jgi:hypothetical protein